MPQNELVHTIAENLKKSEDVNSNTSVQLIGFLMHVGTNK
jgi:hypothetical protein